MMVEESMATLDSFLQRQNTLHFLKVALDSFDQFDLEITWQMQPWKLVLKHMLKTSTLSNWNNTWELKLALRNWLLKQYGDCLSPHPYCTQFR